MFKPCFMFSALRLCSKNNTDGGSFRVFAVRQWDVGLPKQSPQPPERSRKSPQAGFTTCSSASSVLSVETEHPIRLNQIYYYANFTIHSHRVDVFSPDHMAIPYTYSPCEYRIFMLLSYDVLRWYRKTYSTICLHWCRSQSIQLVVIHRIVYWSHCS